MSLNISLSMNQKCIKLISISFNKISMQHFDGGAPMKIKEEPDDCGIRSIQKVPSLSDLSDPENSLGKSTNRLFHSLKHFTKLTHSIVVYSALPFYRFLSITPFVFAAVFKTFGAKKDCQKRFKSTKNVAFVIRVPIFFYLGVLAWSIGFLNIKILSYHQIISNHSFYSNHWV